MKCLFSPYDEIGFWLPLQKMWKLVWYLSRKCLRFNITYYRISVNLSFRAVEKAAMWVLHQKLDCEYSEIQYMRQSSLPLQCSIKVPDLENIKKNVSWKNGNILSCFTLISWLVEEIKISFFERHCIYSCVVSSRHLCWLPFTTIQQVLSFFRKIKLKSFLYDRVINLHVTNSCETIFYR